MTRTPGRHTFDSSNTRHNVERFLALLASSHTYVEIQAALHMSARSVRLYIKHLRCKDNQRVYLCGWRLIDGRYQASFKVGSRKDAKQPKQTDQEKNAKWRAKVKADPDLSERRYKYEAARWLARKPKAAQSWLSALGA